MDEGRLPSSKLASSQPYQPYQTQRPSFNPLNLLYRAVDYGEATWNAIRKHKDTGHPLTPLLNLTYIIEEHIKNLVDLCPSPKDNQSHYNFTLESLKLFYSSPEIYKPHLTTNLALQFFSGSVTATLSHPNYYQNLSNFESPCLDTNLHCNMFSQSSDTPKSMASSDNKSLPSQPSYFVEDLGISEISDIVLNQVQIDQTTMLEDEGVEMTDLVSPTEKLTLDTPIQQRFRLNLIRHRFARTTDIKNIQLFESFTIALCKADTQISILPIDSKKQQYTSLVSTKQIDSLNERQLALYFTPWFKEQHYSLSGFIHISSALSLQELLDQIPVAEWLDTYQYSVKKCPSQSEEMSMVGALCYGSSWIYREDLKLKILQHPVWNNFNIDPDHPIIIDLIQHPFRGPKHSVPMIFVATECSTIELVREALQILYDRTSKAYPRGDMLFFIPLKGNDPYSPEQRTKFIFNHETYLGTEDVIAIHGLNDLNTEITLKGGKVTDIHTLLKSLPATTGISRNHLFQVVDPNAGITCTIATFQQKDKPFIEQRKPTLESEIRSCLAPGESIKVFQDDVEGMWFGGTIKRRNGKPISIQAHTLSPSYNMQTTY
jgi:hypothetical protein